MNVMRVLKEQRSGQGDVRVVARSHCGFDLLGGHDTRLGRDWPDLHPGDSRRAGRLI